jgi:hypothetical protein
MTPLAGTAADQPLLPDADQVPLDAQALAVPQYPGTAATDDVAGTAGAETLAPDLAAGAQPGLAQTPPAAAGGSSPDERWHEIQAMFVDDPRSAVELAASLADDSAETVIASVRERQQALRSPWQRDDTGTEELRIALRHYREFWNRLRDAPREL